MSTVLRHTRKGSDVDILRQNALGLSLSAIAENIGCHPTSISLRLKSLNVRAADTRRAFMDDIYGKLPADMLVDIGDMLQGNGMSVKDYVRKLITDDMTIRKHNQIHSNFTAEAAISHG
jgi:hypothetical protein